MDESSSPDPIVTDEQEDSSSWQRLSPLSVIFFLGKVLSHLLKDALPGLAPLIVVVANSDDKVWLTSLILVGAAILLIGSSVLQYLFFKFSITDSKVLIKEGVFKKQHRSISFERIQNINILEPFYFRPFKLVTLQLETAGSAGNEANLAGISLKFAHELKQLALAQKAKAQTSLEEVESSEQNSSELLASATTKQLVQYGLTNNGMFWFFVFLAPFIGFIDNYIESDTGQKYAEQLVAFLGGGLFAQVSIVILIIVGLITLMVLFSILGSIFRYHGYTLSLNEETLKRRGGLINTHEESAKRKKIQAVIRQTNFIGTWLRVENIILKQASGQQKQNQRNNLFVIPTRQADEAKKLKQVIFNEPSEEYDIYGIDKRYCFKTWFILMIIPSLLICLLSLSNSWLFSLLFIPCGLLSLAVAKRRWKKYAYGLGENYGYFQKGFVGFRKTEFPLYKVQRAEIKQSPLQRKRNLATLVLYFASQRLAIPFMPIQHAEDWFDIINYRIEKTQKSWF